MVGADPKFQQLDDAGRVISPDAPYWPVPAPLHRAACVDGDGSPSSRHSCRCHSCWFNAARRRAPECWPPMPTPRPAIRSRTAFRRRRSSDRFPTTSESLTPLQPAAAAPRGRTAQAEPAPYRVASLAPTAPYQRPAGEDQTMLVGLKSSAFPYLGNNPRTDEPFLNISKGDRRGHRSYGGRVYWQDETYNDNRVLMHVPGKLRCPQTRRHRGVLPRQRRDAGARRARPAAGAAADFGFRRQRGAAGAAACGRRRRFQRRQVLATGRAEALRRRVGRSSRPPLRRSAHGQGFRQHAGRHRRLQRRLHAGGLEPRGRRPRQPRARRVPARRGLWRTGQVRLLDRQQPLRLLRQRLYPLHPPARASS